MKPAVGPAFVAVLALIAIRGPAVAAVMTGPIDLAAFTSGASYGPPSPAHFTEPGPITVTSGTPTPFFAGPNYGDVTSLLLVISGAIPAGDLITLAYGALAPVTFSAADFVSTAVAGFPSDIGGIANGNLNGVVFPTALHAGAELSQLLSGLSTDQFLADVIVSQTIPTNLRLDVFGAFNGTIVNNASNSGGIGVSGSGPVPGGGSAVAAIPEPPSLAVCGAALLGFALIARRRRRP